MEFSSLEKYYNFVTKSKEKNVFFSNKPIKNIFGIILYQQLYLLNAFALIFPFDFFFEKWCQIAQNFRKDIDKFEFW